MMQVKRFGHIRSMELLLLNQSSRKLLGQKFPVYKKNTNYLKKLFESKLLQLAKKT